MLKFKCPKTQRPVYPLKSKVVCGCCRHTMQVAPRLQRAFVCRYTKVDESAECYNLEISEKELEDLLFTIISKQAQVILNADNLSRSENIPLNIEQQSEYEKRITLLREEKRQLYEGFVLGKTTAEVYKTKKSVVEAELSRINRAYDSLRAETAVMVATKSSDDEIRSLAESASGESKLSRAIMELLIDKVYVYPGNRIEIAWKAAGFAANIKEDFENVG